MPDSELVRVRLGNIEKNVGRVYAESLELDVLDDEPTHNLDGTVRGETRSNGRQNKPRNNPAPAKTAAKTEKKEQQS